MKTSNIIVASFIIATLTLTTLPPIYAQTSTGINPEITHNESPYYEIKADTADGGKVVVNFRWQKTVEWWGQTLSFSTPPTLSISKLKGDDSLNYSITYMPLYIIQYNDTNENGLFDLGFTSNTDWGADYDSLSHHESIYSMYPLAPIIHWILDEAAWNWDVTDLVDKKIVVNEVETHEYSWNVSATLTSFPWTWKWGWEDGTDSTLDVTFRYHLTFYPTGPEVKYDFNFSKISWIKPDAKIAMSSAITYAGEKSPILKTDGWSCKDFNDTKHVTDPKFTISDEIEEKILAWTVTYENATVDHQDNIQPIEWAIHPIFLFPIGLHPYGTYFEGTTLNGTYKMGFAHQLGLPHFEEYVSQDPVVGLAATLSTIILPFLPLPGDLLSLNVIIPIVIIVTIAFAIYSKMKFPAKMWRDF